MLDRSAGLETIQFFPDFRSNGPWQHAAMRKVTEVCIAKLLQPLVPVLQNISRLDLWSLGVMPADTFWETLSTFPSLRGLNLNYMASRELARISSFTGHLEQRVIRHVSYEAMEEAQLQLGATALSTKVGIAVFGQDDGMSLWKLDDDETFQAEKSRRIAVWTGLPNVHFWNVTARDSKYVWDEHVLWPVLRGS